MDRQEVIDTLTTIARGPKTAKDYSEGCTVIFLRREEVSKVVMEAAMRLKVCEGCATCYKLLQEEGIEY